MQSPLFQDNVSYLSVANHRFAFTVFRCSVLLRSFCSLNILKEFSGLHYRLFVKVLVFHFVSKALYLLCFCCLCVSHATCLYYHVSCFVSTTFLTFLFFSFACLLCLLIAAKTIISFTFTFINRKYKKKTG